MYGLDAKKLNQEKLNYLLKKYKNSPSFIAKKNSFKGSKVNILKKFMEDYKNGNEAATKCARECEFVPN